MMRAAAVCLLLALVCAAEASTTRRVYVAADEVDWDYAPNGDKYEVDQEIDYRVDAVTFIEPGPDRIGSVYTKAIYREYTDATFSNLATRSRDMEHLGILGPTVWAEVGDNIEVWTLGTGTAPPGLTRSSSTSATMPASTSLFILMESSTRRTQRARSTPTTPSPQATLCCQARRTHTCGLSLPEQVRFRLAWLRSLLSPLLSAPSSPPPSEGASLLFLSLSFLSDTCPDQL